MLSPCQSRSASPKTAQAPTLQCRWGETRTPTASPAGSSGILEPTTPKRTFSPMPRHSGRWHSSTHWGRRRARRGQMRFARTSYGHTKRRGFVLFADFYSHFYSHFLFYAANFISRTHAAENKSQRDLDCGITEENPRGI